MKNVYIVLSCLFAVLLTNCQFSENIYINEDGSGKMKFSLDASEMMQMVSEMGDGKSSEDLEKAMDSTIVFKDFIEEYKDSIATLSQEEQQKIKALEDFRLHMVMDPEQNSMTMDLETDFKDANSLQDMFKAMNSFSNLQGKGGASQNTPSSPFSSMADDGSTTVNYAFDGKIFKRNVEIVDVEKHQQSIDSLGQSAMMFGGSNYKINYHFPRAVKSFSKEGAMFSEDRKTVTFEVGFIDMLKDPKLLDFEVVLED
ncbi:hypothetical protein [Winogradskyella schleiferi]|uniref:hypothetical protein n=1 Tax=Winogradskyella schleiferi TaxID=2686078 RepID=UPI0015B8021B|nr:hypothetical protein [Winogradskyella schleiferi]